MGKIIKNNKIVVAGLVVLFVGLILGLSLFLHSQFKSKEKNSSKEAQNSAIQDVFGGLMIPILSGKVTAVSSGKKFINVEVTNVLGFDLPKEYQNKKLIINENTKIVLEENKSSEVFEKEIQNYKSEIEKSGDLMAVTPPNPYSEKDIKIDDLKVGDSVSFVLATEEKPNILDNQFTVSRINVVR